jgi:hypothetical protein
MIPFALLPNATDYSLLKIKPDADVNNTNGLSVVYKVLADTPRKRLPIFKPQQVAAGTIFRLLGLQAIPVCKANTGFMQAAANPVEETLDKIPADVVKATEQTIKRVQQFAKNNKAVLQGETRKNNVADYLCDINADGDDEDVIAFSKVFNGKGFVVIYNTNKNEAKEKFVLLDNSLEAASNRLQVVCGYDASGAVHIFNTTVHGKNTAFIKLYLKPLHLVVLKNY